MRDGMTDGSPPTDPTPNHPEHEAWARDPGALRGFDPALELPGMPPVSTDFVARTWARIQADRRQIEAEAARVDDAPLPAELLRAYAAPEPSSDFVARTLARIPARRADDEFVDPDLRAALEAFAPPPTRGDLVERTLAALRLERTRLRIVGDEPDRAAASSPGRHAARRTAAAQPATGREPAGRGEFAGRRWRRLAWAAAAVVAVTSGGALVLRGFGGTGEGADRAAPDAVVQVALPGPVPPAAEVFSPTPVGTAVARTAERGHVGARLGQGDGLLLFAALDAAPSVLGGPR